MFKKIALTLSLGLLTLFLSFSLSILPFTLKLTNRQTVKTWVGNDEFLKAVVQALPDMAAESQTDNAQTPDNLTQTLEAGGLDTSILAPAAEEVFTSDYMREKLYPVIDGFYDWLEGKTESPQFSITFNDRLTSLADSISDPLSSELGKLPACPAGTVFDSQFDPLSAQCIPEGTNVNQIISDFSKEFTQSDNPLSTAITSDDLQLDEETLDYGPKAYSAAQKLPLFFGIAILLFSLLSIASAATLESGLKKVSWSFIINGALMAVFFWALGSLDQLFSFDSSDLSEAAINGIMKPLLNVVFSDISKTGMALSTISVGIGVAIYLANITHRKLSHGAAPSNSPSLT